MLKNRRLEGKKKDGGRKRVCATRTEVFELGNKAFKDKDGEGALLC